MSPSFFHILQAIVSRWCLRYGPSRKPSFSYSLIIQEISCSNVRPATLGHCLERSEESFSNAAKIPFKIRNATYHCGIEELRLRRSSVKTSKVIQGSIRLPMLSNVTRKHRVLVLGISQQSMLWPRRRGRAGRVCRKNRIALGSQTRARARQRNFVEGHY